MLVLELRRLAYIRSSGAGFSAHCPCVSAVHNPPNIPIRQMLLAGGFSSTHLSSVPATIRPILPSSSFHVYRQDAF